MNNLTSIMTEKGYYNNKELSLASGVRDQVISMMRNNKQSFTKINGDISDAYKKIAKTLGVAPAEIMPDIDVVRDYYKGRFDVVKKPYIVEKMNSGKITCLGCDNKFKSSHKFNRLCANCKKRGHGE